MAVNERCIPGAGMSAGWLNYDTVNSAIVAEAAGDGAVTYRGRMVDIAMLERAKETLRPAERYEMPVPEGRI